jgi:hypothetical protein
VSDEETVPLKLVKIDEEAIRVHIHRVERPCDAAGKVCKSLFDTASAADGFPSSRADPWPARPNGADLGICLFDKRKPKHIRKKLRTAAEWLVCQRSIAPRQRRRNVVVDLGAHPGAILEESHHIHGPVHVSAMDQLPCKPWPKRDRIQGLYEITIVELALKNTP